MSYTKKLGTLVVVVLKARNLKDSHTFYKQDPYTLVRLGRTEKKTKVDVRGGQHPVWDEELHLPVLEPAPGVDVRTLTVAAYSKESKVDELIGEGTLDISSTLVKGEFDDWVKLETNGAYRGEIYLEMTFYSAVPPLARRPTKLSPNDRVWRPPATPPKDTTSPYISPQRSPQVRPTLSAGSSPLLQPVPSPHLHPSSPYLYPAYYSASASSTPHQEEARLSPALPSLSPSNSPLFQPVPSPHLHPSSPYLYPAGSSASASSSPRQEEARLSPALPSLSPSKPPLVQPVPPPYLQPSSPYLYPASPSASASSSPSHKEARLPLAPPTASPHPRPSYVDPTLKNIPFLDVGPSATYLAPAPTPALHSVPSILRPRNVKSSPIPVPTEGDNPPPPKNDMDDPNRRFQHELAESDAEFAVRLATAEGIDVERLKAEEADAELARRLADERDETPIPGRWVG